MKALRRRDYRTMPWKNGGGFTTEIAVFPERADLAGFGWRVSMATVAQDGPFSVFPGIDRTLSILEGEGMTLTVEGRRPVTLTENSVPFAFPADTPTTATLVSAGILDLNVMTRRGEWTHRVERKNIDGRSAVIPSGDVVLVLALGNLSLDDGRQSIELSRLDCVILSENASIDSVTPTEAFVTRFTTG